MTAFIVKRIEKSPVPNGEEYVTRRLKIENVTYVSVSQLGIFTIGVGETTYAYDSKDYMLNLIG